MKRLILSCALLLLLAPIVHRPFAQEEEDLGGVIEKYRGLLAIANQKLEDLELPDALARFTEVIDGYKTGQLPSATPLTRQLVGQAYEGRARTYANLGRSAEAEADFEALIRFDSAWPIDRTRTSPKIVALYDKARARLIGRLAVQTEPPGAAVSLDGEPIGRAPFERDVTAGRHTIIVELPGHEPAQESIEVAGGTQTDRVIRLVRNTRGVLLSTAPAGARVSVDGEARGSTFGAAGPEAAGEAQALGLTPAEISSPLLIENLRPGAHTLKVEMECHEPQTLSVPVALDPNDPSPQRLEIVRLSPSQGSISFETLPAGTEVILDGKPAGRTPLKVDSVCSGRHQIRLRHPEAGQWVGPVDLARGQRLSVKEKLRFSLAWAGMTEAGPGGQPPEGETELTRALSASTSLAVLSPGAGLPDEWRARSRVNASGQLPADYVSGAAAATGADLLLVALPGEGAFERRAELLLFSGRFPSLPPDRLVVRADDPADLKALVARLETPTPLSRPWLGVHTIEVHRAVNPIAIRVEPGSPAAKAGVKLGDALVSLGGKGLARPRDLESAMAVMKEGGQASLMVQTSGAAPRPLNVALGSTPMMVGMDEPAMLYTRLAAEMSWRSRMEGSTGRADSPERVTSLLNLAVSLMQRGAWDTALKESLDRLNLPPGPGISAGTVGYLRGVCLKALKRLPEARQQLEAAAGQSDATLWSHDGPPVAERARRLLVGL